ncbi:MAG: type II secretion system protein [Candidatus Omnitrophota bacterium]|nr:type II secretion system protein [Candidatus Omnitrophota bacterium]
MSRSGRKNSFLSKRAFTLVEVILAITIFSFIAVGISTSFFSGMKLWGRAISTDSWRNDILLGFESVSAELRQGVDIPAIGYKGDAKSFSFPAPSGNSIVKASYLFDAQKKALVRSETKLKDILREDIIGSTGGKSMLYLDDFSVQYLYRDPLTEISEWKTEWKKEDGVFIAVKFTGKSHNEEFNKTVFIPIAG